MLSSAAAPVSFLRVMLALITLRGGARGARSAVVLAMFSGRHELRCAWKRYLVCRSSDGSAYDGRVLQGYEAKGVITALLATPDAQQVRALYADLSASFDLRRVSDGEVGRWFSHELADSPSGSRVGGIVLVEVPLFGRVERRAQQPAFERAAVSEAERLVRALDDARGKGDLIHDGGDFRLVIGAGPRQMPGRERYQALGAPEAQRLLQTMAENTRRPESVRALLEKAAALVSAGQNGPSNEQLVLLRRAPFTGPAAQPAEPPPPARSPRARKPKQRSYIVVEIYSDQGAPMPGVLLELAAPDGTLTKLTTDEFGEVGLRNIDPGSYGTRLVDPPGR